MSQHALTRPASFEALYRAERPALVRLAYLVCGSSLAAEDIVQDAFIALEPRFAAVAERFARRAERHDP